MKSLDLEVPQFFHPPHRKWTGRLIISKANWLALPSPGAQEWDDVPPKVFMYHIRGTVALFIHCLEQRGISDELLFLIKEEMELPKPDKKQCSLWLKELECLTAEYAPTGEFFGANPDLGRALYIALVMMIRKGW
jgi:hypothetical protein